MKMAKPSALDIEAADELMQVLQLIDARFGGPWANPDAGESLSKLLEGSEDEFDADNTTHLQTLYNNLALLLRRAPNFHGRVIGGMCHVIMNEKNEVLDPASDCIDLHPRFQRLAERVQALETDLTQTKATSIPVGAVAMPASLTAENGAKGLLTGEFRIQHAVNCSGCYFDESDPECEVCGGHIEYIEYVDVPWATIKDIYARAVSGLALEKFND